MAKEPLGHQEQIDNQLRSIVAVQSVEGGYLADPAFWERCSLMNPDWRTTPPARVYVDGYIGGCMWNTWKVTQEHPDAGLRVFYGYAFGQGQWSEHCWSANDDFIVETTGAMDIYYGAELNEAEIAVLVEKCTDHDPLEEAQGLFWTYYYIARKPLPIEGERKPQPARQVNTSTGEPLDGLTLE